MSLFLNWILFCCPRAFALYLLRLAFTKDITQIQISVIWEIFFIALLHSWSTRERLLLDLTQRVEIIRESLSKAAVFRAHFYFYRHKWKYFLFRLAGFVWMFIFDRELFCFFFPLLNFYFVFFSLTQLQKQAKFFFRKMFIFHFLHYSRAYADLFRVRTNLCDFLKTIE